MTGSAYSGRSMLSARIMSAMSLPHTDVWSAPLGTITLETREERAAHLVMMTVSVVTKTWFAG